MSEPLAAPAASPTSTPGITTQRIEAFSDGVFAIVITLFVLELRVPQLPASHSEFELLHELGTLWPKVLSFVLSFAIVGVFWVGHHNVPLHPARRPEPALAQQPVPAVRVVHPVPHRVDGRLHPGSDRGDPLRAVDHGHLVRGDPVLALRRVPAPAGRSRPRPAAGKGPAASGAFGSLRRFGASKVPSPSPDLTTRAIPIP